MQQTLLKRFIRYVQVDTQSNPNSQTVPSTPGQLKLANMLAEELKSIGLDNVRLDNNGYVMATLPGDESLPKVGFVAHMDTAPDYSGKDVKPQIIENYQGEDILLGGSGEMLSTQQFPALNSYIGNTLITTDGTTLLGADDKAGIAAIISAMEYLIEHPEIRRPSIQIGFTPDEEIGRGADHFDVQEFNADWAYTIDGGRLGEFEYESFNAASAFVHIRGNNVHPGTAKGILVNSQQAAARFVSSMPSEQTPECTEGYEGFFHLVDMQGTVENTKMHYLIRDFDSDAFESRKVFMEKKVAELNQSLNSELATIEIRDSYFNMREPIEASPECVDIALQAMESVGLKPLVEPIRGGTDGSRLSFMGLPCPNIFTGGHNYHGRHEFISLDSLELSTRVIIEICNQVTLR